MASKQKFPSETVVSGSDSPASADRPSLDVGGDFSRAAAIELNTRSLAAVFSIKFAALISRGKGRRKFFSVKVAGDFSEGGWLCGYRFLGLSEGEVGFASFPGFGDFSEDARDESQE